VARWFRWDLSVAGQPLRLPVPPPCFRFHTPLSERDVRICRIKTHAIAKAIACDAVSNLTEPVPTDHLELLAAEASRSKAERHHDNDYMSSAVPSIAGP
jgi:hypothetical protein